MAVWSKVSEWYEIFCHDSKLMGDNTDCFELEGWSVLLKVDLNRKYRQAITYQRHARGKY